MTSFGRSGDKEDYGERENQRYLFQGHGRGTGVNRTENGADGRSEHERIHSEDVH